MYSSKPSNYYPKWYYPHSISQDSEAITHVPWDSTGNFIHIKSRDLTQTKTVAPLKHIPNSYSTPIRNKTWYLNCKFQLGRESGQVNGIQLQIQMDRGARIVDDTVQLIYNGSPIGDNLATPEIEALKTYGNAWGLTWTDPDVYAMTSGDFGVVLRFQSNFSTPHTTTPALDFVRMRYTVEGETVINKQEARPNIGWTMALTLDKFWIRKPGEKSAESQDGAEITDSDGQGGAGGGYGGSGAGYAGSGPFVGSFGFIGSTGVVGSSGFTGTTGFAGSTFGFIGSGFQNISSYNVIPSIEFLPTTGAYTYQAFLVQTTNQIFYWDNVWILVASP